MYRQIIPYNPKFKERARQLRNKSTLSEILLWHFLKGKQIKGYDFHRQKPIDNYIIDFYCPELKLAIEIDGSSHGDKEEYDKYRQKRLESLGVNFLRFSDYHVKHNIEAVLMRIYDWIDNHERENIKPTPNPSQEGNSVVY